MSLFPHLNYIISISNLSFTMSSQKQTTYKTNDEFKSSKLFDVTGFKAVVTGGTNAIPNSVQDMLNYGA
jgi:hypothetical protein